MHLVVGEILADAKTYTSTSEWDEKYRNTIIVKIARHCQCVGVDGKSTSLFYLSIV